MRFWRRSVAPVRGDAVRRALRDQPGVATVEAVVVAANDERFPEVTVTVRLADGTNATEAACRVIDVLHARLPSAQIRVLVTDKGGKDAS